MIHGSNKRKVKNETPNFNYTERSREGGTQRKCRQEDLPKKRIFLSSNDPDASIRPIVTLSTQGLDSVCDHRTRLLIQCFYTQVRKSQKLIGYVTGLIVGSKKKGFVVSHFFSKFCFTRCPYLL